jgi:hypothetical protein
MIQVPRRTIAGIEIGFGTEPNAVVGERPAALPQNVRVDAAADDLDDRLIRSERSCREQAEAVSRPGDADAR